jgi:hypothetical protein
MLPLATMEPEHRAFLHALYTRSAGDARQGVPYEVLIEALGFGEVVTKRLQRALQQNGLVELTTVPPMTHVGRPVMDRLCRHHCQQTIGLTAQGVQLMEDLLATRRTTPPQPSTPPDYTAWS